MDFDKLKDLSREELVHLAVRQGLTPHHRSKPETIIKQIIEAATTPPKPPLQSMEHPAEKKMPDAAVNTEEAVREACKAFFAKPGFEAIFTPTTWHFRCRGAEDSGHMSTIMRVIRMKADTVSRGARRMVTTKNMDGHDVMMAG